MRKLTFLLVLAMVLLVCGAAWAQMDEGKMMQCDIKNAVFINPSWGGLSPESMELMHGGHMMGMGEHMMGGCRCGCGMEGCKCGMGGGMRMGEHRMGGCRCGCGMEGCKCGMGGCRCGCGMEGCKCGMGEHRMGMGMMGGRMREHLQKPEIKKFLDETKDQRYKLITKKFEYFEAARNPGTTPEELKKLLMEIRNLQLDIFKKSPIDPVDDGEGGDEAGQ